MVEEPKKNLCKCLPHKCEKFANGFGHLRNSECCPTVNNVNSPIGWAILPAYHHLFVFPESAVSSKAANRALAYGVNGHLAFVEVTNGREDLVVVDPCQETKKGKPTAIRDMDKHLT